MLLAVPVGRLADRFGRGRTFVAGYLPLLAAYGLLLLPPARRWCPALPALLGALLRRDRRRADGAGERQSPGRLRGSGLALLVTVDEPGALLGVDPVRHALDVVRTSRRPLAVFAAGLFVAMLLAAAALRLAPEAKLAE